MYAIYRRWSLRSVGLVQAHLHIIKLKSWSPLMLSRHHQFPNTVKADASRCYKWGEIGLTKSYCPLQYLRPLVSDIFQGQSVIQTCTSHWASHHSTAEWQTTLCARRHRLLTYSSPDQLHFELAISVTIWLLFQVCVVAIRVWHKPQAMLARADCNLKTVWNNKFKSKQVKALTFHSVWFCKVKKWNRVKHGGSGVRV